jgi:DNA-directed RNA polymerase subunit alpha
MKEFIFPMKIYWEEKDKTYGRFVVEPLERGYGTTIGNALRRVLLSSVYGSAITAIKIEGVQHEFSTIQGIQEDVLQLIANLKNLRFDLKDSDLEILYLEKSTPGVVLASDIKTPPNVNIVNKDAYIATINAPNTSLKIEMRIERGKGYVMSEELEQIGEIGWIVLDADFSPVKIATFHVEATRVADRTDYDKLTFEVSTNGVVSPEVAVQQSVELITKHMNMLTNISYEVPTLPEPMPPDELMEKLTFSTEELDISQRALNSLKRIGVTTIGELVQLTEDELKSSKNIGRKALTEIKEALKNMGFSLGMNIGEQRRTEV